MKNLKINLIPGDGIGVDVIHEGRKVLETLAEIDGGLKFDFCTLPWSCEYYLQHGVMMPADGLKILADCDAVLLGAVGGWQWDNLPGDKRPERALLGLRSGLGLYANLRPAALHPALAGACPPQM